MGSSSVAALVGGVLGAAAISGTVVLLVWICMTQCRKMSNKNSESGSTDPSGVAEMTRGGSSPLSVPSLAESRQFKMEELEQATRNFDESKIIGCGTFGLVYKGLLRDGTVVAIKRRNGEPKQELSDEVAILSRIQHRNLVKLLGCCQERGYQMLVSEYLPNGSMYSHLYDNGQGFKTKLEFKQRLSVAICAAKGLCHLHGLTPPVVHGNYKTTNVLVDENFIAKVADAGVLRVLETLEGGTLSSSSSFNPFRDPELGQVAMFSEPSDVYSFGVFLLELVTGKESTTYKEAFGSNDSILHWIEGKLRLNDLVDHRLAGSFTAEGMTDLLKLMLRCMSFPGRTRPRMESVVLEADRILETEVQRTIVMGEGTTTFIPGSELFTS